MVTHSEKIAELKAKYPTIKTGDDLTGYVELSADEYEQKIVEWANVELARDAAQEAENAKKEAEEIAKEAALAKLTALGLTLDDLAALGL